MYNDEEILILQYNNQKSCWEDITRQVQFYERDVNSYAVRYVNSETLYHKSFKAWKVFTSPVVVSINEVLVYINGNLFTNVKKIIKFGEWNKVFFDNSTVRIYRNSCMKMVRGIQNKNRAKQVISYLKEISKIVAVDDDKDFLYNQLDKMTIPQNSILAKLIENKIGKIEDKKCVIFPFATNLSQKEAVDRAIKNHLSVIQGPPGTGKTQTILNIIANCLYRNQTVAVLSANNEAIKNVCDKISEKGYEFLNAFLGKRDNVKEFIDKQLVNTIGTKKKTSNLSNLLNDLERITEIHDKCLENEVESARIKQIINELLIEKEINDVENCISEHKIPLKIDQKKYTSKKILELSSILEVLPKKKLTSFFIRARLLFRFGITNMKKIASNLQESIGYLKKNYYLQKIDELQKELKEKEDFLIMHDSKSISQKQMEISKEILDTTLYEKYRNFKQTTFNIGTYKDNFLEFVNNYPIVYSTTHAIRSCSGKSFVYDCVIIDESSQVDLVTAVIAFSCAKRVVLVGDEKQLTHVVDSKLVQQMEEIFQKYELPSHLNYVHNNILCYVNKALTNIPNSFLNEHYRCDPQIIEFCNKRFYSGQLVVHNVHQKGNGVTIITHGSHFCRGRTNERQVDIIEKEIIPSISFPNIGIIAPYNDQVKLLKEKFAHIPNCVIDTIHKFQGKESKCIMISTVSNKVKVYEDDSKIDFLNNPNLINVAISRAEEHLYILVSEELTRQNGTIIKDLLKYYEYYCDETKITKTNVYSVFDLMYDDYAPILEEMKKKLLHVSEFDSENICATVIKEICESGMYGALDFKINFPLKFVLKLSSITDADDRKFVSNINTHCDFIIYSKLNKEILLEVEVDGGQHKEPVQAARDNRKDRLLSSAGIKQLRLSTTSIECKEKIISKLINP